MTGQTRWDYARRNRSNYVGFAPRKPVKLRGTGHESGYQNLEETHQKGWGAGIWMFIAPTARNYGLRVDSQADERLNPARLTDAAMRYLKSNNLMFRDWLLAILAYNAGERAVSQAIHATGSRDAWTLVRRGYESDKDYLAKVMAAVLIMKNPDSVN